MLEEYFSNEYVRAISVFLIVFLAVKLLGYLLQVVVPKFTQKTKTTLDDEILRRISRPLTWIAILLGIRFAIGEIGLGETINQNIEGVVLTFIIVVSSFLVYYILDALIIIGFAEFGKKSKLKVNDSLLQFFHSILRIVVVVGAFLVILSSWGIEIGPLLAGIGVAGLAIAFALQSTLANVFGGISMILDKSVQIGDVIKLSDGTTGKVKIINLRSTKLVTFDNELIIVPNAVLSEGSIQNLALPEKKARVVVPFGVAYGTDITKVKKIILAEIKKVENYIPEPEPSVKFLEMADSSLNFKAYFYVNSYAVRLGALDEANTRIYNALNKAGIEIPFPQMDVNLKK